MVKNAEEVEEVEDEDDAAEASFLTRKLASLGMRAWAYYTPGRRQSEDQVKFRQFSIPALFGRNLESLLKADLLSTLWPIPYTFGGSIPRLPNKTLKHARYYWLLLAEGHLTRQRFGSMLRGIAALPLPNG